MINLNDSEFLKNPHPILKRKREFEPICKLEPLGYWGVTRYHHIVEIAKNTEVFSSAAYNRPDILLPQLRRFSLQKSLIALDPPIHSKMRRPLAKIFTPKYLKSLENGLRKTCLNFLDRLSRPSEAFDLAKHFTIPFPVEIIAEILGVDSSMHKKFKAWSDGLLALTPVSQLPLSEDREKKIMYLVRNQEEFAKYFEQIIEHKLHSPGDDLISLIISTCEKEDMVTPEFLYSMTRLFLVAGNETTTNLLNSALIVLANSEGLLVQLQKDISLLSRFVEELLRFDGPILGVPRTITRDYEIDGHRFKEGEHLTLLLASGNRDETVFKNADQFDLNRDHSKVISFGHGVHTCIGSHLARMEAKIALEELLPLIKCIRIMEPLKPISSFIVKGTEKLTVKISWQ
ncbi:MAG: cytochrome P450 [Oligoflexales bacterium]